MKVAIIYNKDLSGVINQFGLQNKEKYNPNTVNKIAEALERGGHNVQIIDGNMHVIESLQEFMPKVIEGEHTGMVFNMAYGIQGESRYTHLPSMLEMLGIPYVGSGPAGHALALDKVITKLIMQRYNIQTPQFWVFSTEEEDVSDVRYPAIVKPKMEAVSYGLRVVHNEGELRKAVKYVISDFQQQALVEQFIYGREFCVGLLGNGDPEAFPIVEIDLGGDPEAIQTEFDKLNNPRDKICPTNASPELGAKMVELSKQAFNALGLKDFARVDIRMDKGDNIYLLEINSMASLGLTGSYVHAAQAAGYDYTRLVNKMLDVAAVRYFSESFHIQNDLPPIKTKMPLSVRLRGFLRSNTDKTEKLLTKMVNINSYVRNVDGVNTLGKLVQKRLRPLGFDLQIIPQVEIGNVLFFSNTKTELDILFLNHLDNSTPFTKQINYRETTHKLYGTAIWNSKGGLAVMIAALRALRFTRLLRKMKIGILLTTDTILQSRVTRNTIVEILRKPKTVIGLSGASPVGSVITSRSGAAVYDCQMNLENANSVEDIAMANASFNNLLANFNKLSNETENVLVTLRDVSMKSGISTLYAHGEASLSVRFNDKQQEEMINQKIHQIVKKTKSRKCHFQISGSVRRPPMIRTQEVERLYTHIKDICSSLDIRVSEEHRWSSSDICFVESTKPQIDGLGPVGSAPHDDEEYILRHSLLDRAILLSMLLNTLRQKKA
ncbi:MAG: ATP-grasp domain-containing protein [bacterium]